MRRLPRKPWNSNSLRGRPAMCSTSTRYSSPEMRSGRYLKPSGSSACGASNKPAWETCMHCRVWRRSASPPVATVAFALLRHGLGFGPAISRQGAPNVDLFFGEFARLAPADIAFVALVGLDQCSRHWMAPFVRRQPVFLRAVPRWNTAQALTLD